MHNTLRRTTGISLIIAFALSLFLTMNAAVTTFVFSTPEQLKKIVDNSGIYANVPGVVIAEAERSIQDDTNRDITLPVNEPGIQAATKAALPPEVLRTNTEQVIDSMFRWLNGEVDKPDFRLDLTESKQTFINGVGDYAEGRAAGLPACTLAELQAIDTQNVFTIPCLPPGITAAQVGAQARNETQDQELIRDPIVTIDTFTKEGERDVFSQNPHIPKQFQASKSYFWFLVPFAILMGTALVFIYENKRRGMLRAATVLIVIAICAALVAIFLGFVSGSLTNVEGDMHQVTRDIFVPLAQEAIRTTSPIFIIFAMVTGLIAAALLVGRHFIQDSNDSGDDSEHYSSTPHKPLKEPTSANLRSKK